MNEIVVGVDGSEHSRRALRWAVDQAQRLGDTSVAAVMAWHVPVPGGTYSAPVVIDADALEEAHRVELDRILGGVQDRETPLTGELACDSPARALLERATDAVLLVVGTRGHGSITGLLLGSVSHQVLGRAQCPVAVIGEHAATTSAEGPIVVGVDGSEGARHALGWALGEARRREVRVHALLAWQHPVTSLYVVAPDQVEEALGDMARYDLDQTLESLSADDRELVDASMVAGVAVPTLVEAARDASLLVVGSRGRTRLAGAVLGSVSEGVAARARCPVVVVPGSCAGAESADTA